MICEHCKQRHANVTVTQVQNGQKFERHYCEECAQQFHPFQFETSEEAASLQQFVSNWFNFFPSTTKKERTANTERENLTCPSCGFTYRHFLKQGKFGCEHCYETFSTQLPPLLEKIQAGTKHVGFVEEAPSKEKVEQKITKLREQIKEAIHVENFEEAAKIRDEIRMLENKMHQTGREQA